MKYTKKQIQESIEHWKRVLEEAESSIPVISSISEFLELCKERGIDAQKKRAAKQGKIVNAEIAQEDKQIKSREGMETAHKGDLVIDDGDGTSYAVPAAKISEYYELDKDGNSATGDQTKWKKIGKELDYYITPFDVDVKVEWQDEPLHAVAGYSLVCNDKEGKDLSPVAPEVFADKSLWKPLSESKQYTKKQITESISHWKQILEDMEKRDIADIPLEEIKADLEGNAEIAQLPDGKWILKADAMMPPRDIDQKSATAYIKWIVNYIDTFNAKYGADVDLVCFDETEKKMGAKEIFTAKNGEKLMRFFYAFDYMMKIA